MNADDAIAADIAEWQHKHHIADDDPMLAALDLVRDHLSDVRKNDDKPDSEPPAVDHLRGAIALLDQRSKAFVSEASDLSVELSRFGPALERITQQRFVTLLAFTVSGLIIGTLIGYLL